MSSIDINIPVNNAGIVLLNSYIPFLFERLELVVDRKFIDAVSQEQAVHYLQYVITGTTDTDEQFLSLNKVLCGLPLDHPVGNGITIAEQEQKLVDGLINAVISHWPSIGATSVDGFRGNWLVRAGLLQAHPEKWELVVDKRAYDILINRSPFSISRIRFPWMDKQLQVQWPF